MTANGWLLIGLLTCGIELVGGGFYLLGVGLAFMLTGGVVALVDDLGYFQWLIAEIAVAASIILVTYARKRGWLGAPPERPVTIAHNGQSLQVNRAPMEEGQYVHVLRWLSDGSATVRYRGAEWNAIKIADDMPDAQRGVIRFMTGATLVIDTVGQPAHPLPRIDISASFGS